MDLVYSVNTHFCREDPFRGPLGATAKDVYDLVRILNSEGARVTAVRLIGQINGGNLRLMVSMTDLEHHAISEGSTIYLRDQISLQGAVETSRLAKEMLGLPPAARDLNATLEREVQDSLGSYVKFEDPSGNMAGTIRFERTHGSPGKAALVGFGGLLGGAVVSVMGLGYIFQGITQGTMGYEVVVIPTAGVLISAVGSIGGLLLAYSGSSCLRTQIECSAPDGDQRAKVLAEKIKEEFS